MVKPINLKKVLLKEEDKNTIAIILIAEQL